MRIIRSWPATIPAGRAYVHDEHERLVIDDHDYHSLDSIDDDILLLEWDIAVGREDLAEFAARAAAAPGRVLVAPYQLYFYASQRERAPVWAHRRYEGTPETGTLRHVTPADESCHLWGLGMTYLPRHVVRAFLDAYPDVHFSDTSLSGWHYRNVEQDVPVTWDIRPVHLHYDVTTLRGSHD